MALSYFQKLVNKAQQTTDSAEAQAIKSKLISMGKKGAIIGYGCCFLCFVGFTLFGYLNVSSMGEYMVPMLICFFLIIPAALLGAIGASGLKLGVGIIIAEKATDFLDTTARCPQCGDPIEEDEMYCSNCGELILKNKVCASCGQENAIEANYCKNCGNKLE